MDQSVIPGQKEENKIYNYGHKSTWTPTHKPSKKPKSAKPSKSYERVARIFELIDKLSEPQKIEILSTLDPANIAKVLRQVVIGLPSNELLCLQEKLERICLGMRNQPRKECILTVDYCYEDRPYCDFVKDISESGAFIYTQVNFEKEDEIDLSFYFPDKELPITFTGEVVRSEESGVGIRFIKQGSYQKDILKSLLKKLD